MKNLVIPIVAIVGVAVLLTAFFLSESSLPEYSIEIGGTTVIVELADSPEEQEKGLSGRSDLGEAKGLLMVFDEPSTPQIWMKDMHFPIDIIWISADGVVVTIKEDAEPCVEASECPVFSPSGTAKYVLEVDAGFSQTHGLEEGDRALLRL